MAPLMPPSENQRSRALAPDNVTVRARKTSWEAGRPKGRLPNLAVGAVYKLAHAVVRLLPRRHTLARVSVLDDRHRPRHVVAEFQVAHVADPLRVAAVTTNKKAALAASPSPSSTPSSITREATVTKAGRWKSPSVAFFTSPIYVGTSSTSRCAFPTSPTSTKTSSRRPFHTGGGATCAAYIPALPEPAMNVALKSFANGTFCAAHVSPGAAWKKGPDMRRRRRGCSRRLRMGTAGLAV